MPTAPEAPTRAPPTWWSGFFDADYLRLWSEFAPQTRSEEEAEGIWRLLDLEPGARVLDAPCGYGRLSLPLARRGAAVLGVDFSATLIDEAEKNRGDLPTDRLRFLRHDLREPLSEGDFDVAIDVFSSLGYGTEEDDRDILQTLADAVRPGGKVFVETMHRDAFVATLARGVKPSRRFSDGTLMLEEPRFDPITGRVDTTWHWHGPADSGTKSASLRMYTITELVGLLEGAGLDFVSAHRGCHPDRFDASGPDLGGRVGLVARRAE